MDAPARTVGTVTISVTDIEPGGPWQADPRPADAVRNYRRIVRAMLARHRGREVDEHRDGFVLVFESASTAIGHACDVTVALRAYAATYPLDAARARFGIHTAEAALADGGAALVRVAHLACLIVGEARTGEVLVSSTVREIVEPTGSRHFAGARRIALDGMPGRHLLHSIVP